MKKFDENSTSIREKRKLSPNQDYFKLKMLVENKKGILARVSTMVSNRGVGIDSLDFKPSSTGSMSKLDFSIIAQRSQMQGILNDVKKLPEVKGISWTV